MALISASVPLNVTLYMMAPSIVKFPLPFMGTASPSNVTEYNGTVGQYEPWGQGFCADRVAAVSPVE
jgi:hypothetical protein